MTVTVPVNGAALAYMANVQLTRQLTIDSLKNDQNLKNSFAAIMLENFT